MVLRPATAGLALVLALGACGGSSTDERTSPRSTAPATADPAGPGGAGLTSTTPGVGEPPPAVQPGSRTTSNGTLPGGVAAPAGVVLSAAAVQTTATPGGSIDGTLTVENRGAGTLTLPAGACAVDAGLFFDGERATPGPACREGGPPEALAAGRSRVYPFTVRATGADGALQEGGYDLIAGLAEAGGIAWAPPVAVRIAG